MNKGTPGLSTPGLGNPSPGNPSLGNPSLGNSSLGNPNLGNPNLGSPGMGNPGLGTPGLSTLCLGTSSLGQALILSLTFAHVSGLATYIACLGTPSLGTPSLGIQVWVSRSVACKVLTAVSDQFRLQTCSPSLSHVNFSIHGARLSKLSSRSKEIKKTKEKTFC